MKQFFLSIFVILFLIQCSNSDTQKSTNPIDNSSTTSINDSNVDSSSNNPGDIKTTENDSDTINIGNIDTTNNKIDTVNIGNVDTTDSETSDSSIIEDPPIIKLASNNSMTIQLNNKTDGEYSNNDIYIAIIGRNAASDWCYLTPNGDAKVIKGGEDGTNWFYSLDTINGFQVPQVFSSARLYIAMGSKLEIHSVYDVNGDVGIVQPNIANENDANSKKYFEWIEFTVSNGSFWGNSTQVDQFCFPLTMELYDTTYSLVKKVGIEYTRNEVFEMFKNNAPKEFQILVQDPYRIVAPCKGGFEVGSNYETYMDSYIDEVWNKFSTDSLIVEHPLGDFVGKVLDDDRFEFTRVSDGEKFYINAKPNINEVFEGSGVLATGGTEELALEAWMCAALNRHVAHFNNTNEWNNSDNYYKDYPMNYYSKFFHDISYNGLSYGFCYDDVNDQSTLMYTNIARAVVINILW